MVQQLACKLPRHDDELLACVPIDHADVDGGGADPLAELRGKVPLDLLARELPDARQERPDPEAGTRLLHERVAGRDAVARVTFPHPHLISAPVGSGRGHGELLPDRPEREQPDPELALDAPGAVRLQAPLDRVTDVGRDIAEIGDTVLIPRDAGSVVGDHEVVLAALPAAHDGDVPRTRVDRVFDELGHGLQGILL